MAAPKTPRSATLHLGLVGLVLLLGACSRNPHEQKLRYLASGEKYYKEGKYAEAALQFRNAIQLDPKSAEAHYQLARTYLNLNNSEAAFRELLETVNLQPENWDAQLDLANLHTGRGEYEEATACVQRVLKANPNHPLAYATLAMKYAAARDLANATLAFEKAIQLAPDRVEFYTGLGRTVYLASGKLAEAEAVFKRATAANPGSAPAYIELARFYVTQRRPEGEVTARTAMKLEPKAVLPRLLLARALNATGRVADAEKELRELKSIAPDDPQAYQALGRFYEEIGDREKAIAEFQSLLSSKPNDIFVKQRLIDNLIALQRLKEADALNQEVLQADKDNSVAHFDRGRILLAQGQYQDAATALQRAAVLAPYNARIHYLLGTAQISLGYTKQARDSFAKALELQPNMTDASVALAGLAVASGDRETALRLTDRALELDPKSISAHLARAQALLAKGDMRQSEAMVLDVLNREPASIPALTLLTSIRVRQGKSKEVLKRIAPLVDQQPENAGLRYLLAVAYYLSGDAQRAESEAKQVLKLDAKTPRAHVLLAAIHFTTGKPEDAKQQLRAAIDVDPRNLNHYLLLASQYEKEQRWDEAIKLYEKARQIDVDSPVLANQLAYLYLEHGGDLNLALDLAQEAKRKLPNSPQVSDTLGWAYYKRGLADQAIAHIRRCVEAIPSNAECQYHLGMAYIAAGNPRAAEKHLRLALKDPGVAWSARAQEALSSIPQGAR